MRGVNLLKTISVIGVCILLGILFHKAYIHEFPSFIHAWAQADHYAITLGFLDNGLNFFKPQTLIYNHQFPDWWASTTETGITSVDFPIHHYIPAVIMDMIGVRSPWVSRLYIFCYSLVGLISIYKLAYLFSKNHIRSLFVVVFAATSPVFVYYQAGFFPSIPSWSNALLGIYFYVLFLKKSEYKHFLLSLVFLTLAALSRTTFVIPLIAVFGNEFLRILFRQTSWKSKLLPVFFSIFSIIGYFLYNKYLRETYSSIFIGYLLPPESLLDFWNILNAIVKRWILDYYSIYHYGIVLVLILGLFFGKKQGNEQGKNTWLLRFIGIYGIGLFLFLIAMSEAFINHDYYFIDTFFIPSIVLLSLLIGQFQPIKSNVINGIEGIILVVLGIGFVQYVFENQIERREVLDYDLATNTQINYQGANEFLTELGVPKTAKILAIDICAPNVPFVMMDRRGHGVFYPTKENLEKAFTWDFDYVVTQNSYFVDRTYKEYPEVINHLKVIGNNGQITVSKYHKASNSQDLNQYLLSGLSNPYISKAYNYEEKASEDWSNVIRVDSLVNNSHVGEMKLKELYGITLKQSNIPQFTEKRSMLRLKADVMIKKGLKSNFVVRLREDSKIKINKTFPLANCIDVDKIGEWQTVEVITSLPKLNSNNNMLSLFLWNPKEDHLYIDDIEVEVY